MQNAHVDHAADDLIQTSVAAIFRRVHERWEQYDADSLTSTESKALFLLLSAGMVERRGRFRLRLINHPVAVEGTFTATGEYGLVEAMEYVSAAMWSDWKDAIHAWRTSDTGDAPAYFCERLKPDEWRLTDQGVLARQDLDSGNSMSVFDFVLRRGVLAQRPSVRGAGALLRMTKLAAEMCSPTDLNIVNWREGADAFAAAFREIMKTRKNGDEGGHAKVSTSSPPTTKRDQLAKWLAEAMLLVRDHPDWSDREIAKRVGKHASTLARSKEYQAAAAMARGNRNERGSGFVTIDPETGLRDVDAVADRDDESDPDDA